MSEGAVPWGDHFLNRPYDVIQCLPQCILGERWGRRTRVDSVLRVTLKKIPDFPKVPDYCPKWSM